MTVYLVGSSSWLKELEMSNTFVWSSLSIYEKEILSWSTTKFLCGSICEWNSLTTVIGTFKPCSMTYPMVTSSGSRIFSPTDSNRPPPMRGIILVAKECERQKPAPPVANQNFTCNDLMACQCAHVSVARLEAEPKRRSAKMRWLPAYYCLCRGSPGALVRRVCLSTSLDGSQTGSICPPGLEHWRNCHHQNGRTICKRTTRVITCIPNETQRGKSSHFWLIYSKIGHLIEENIPSQLNLKKWTRMTQHVTKLL